MRYSPERIGKTRAALQRALMAAEALLSQTQRRLALVQQMPPSERECNRVLILGEQSRQQARVQEVRRQLKQLEPAEMRSNGQEAADLGAIPLADTAALIL